MFGKSGSICPACYRNNEELWSLDGATVFCKLSFKKPGKLTTEDGPPFTAAMRVLTHWQKQLCFWALNIPILWVYVKCFQVDQFFSISYRISNAFPVSWLKLGTYFTYKFLERSSMKPLLRHPILQNFPARFCRYTIRKHDINLTLLGSRRAIYRNFFSEKNILISVFHPVPLWF